GAGRTDHPHEQLPERTELESLPALKGRATEGAVEAPSVLSCLAWDHEPEHVRPLLAAAHPHRHAVDYPGEITTRDLHVVDPGRKRSPRAPAKDAVRWPRPKDHRLAQPHPGSRQRPTRFRVGARRDDHLDGLEPSG